MKLKKFVEVILGIVLPISSSFAGGSIYSQYGIGELNYFMSSQSAGMGGTGLAILSDGYINRFNPAALGRIGQTRFEADFQYRGYSVNDGVNSNFLSSGNFEGAMIAFPIYTPSNIVFSLGVMPLSTVNYQVLTNAVQSDLSVAQSVEGSGGISASQFSLSYSPFNNLNLGGTLHYFFGTTHDIESLEFSETGYFANKNDYQTSAEGFGVTIGGLYTGIDSVLGLSLKKNLNIALTFFSGGTLSAIRQSKQDFVTILDSVTSSKNGTIKIPQGFGAGIAYYARERTLLTADVQAQQWGRLEIFGVHPAEIRNSMRIGVGAEFLGIHGVSEPFGDQVTYRLGGYVNNSYLDVNNQPINEYFITAGAGLPISSYDSQTELNLSLEYGMRGTTAHALQKDSIIRFTLSLSGSELFWFVPPETD